MVTVGSWPRPLLADRPPRRVESTTRTETVAGRVRDWVRKALVMAGIRLPARDEEWGREYLGLGEVGLVLTSAVRTGGWHRRWA